MLRYGAYAGIGVGVAAGAVVLSPIVIGAQRFLPPYPSLLPIAAHGAEVDGTGLAIPTLAIGLPIYGAYKIVS